MKGYPIFLVFLLNTIFYSASAQISDDFSDGNFTDNPVWVGETSRFMVNPEGQLQQNAASEAGQSYLSISSEIIDNAEWNFYVKLEFNPSSNNYLDIYLVSDAMDLTGPVNGYYVRIGNTEDEISLYKQLGDKSSSQKIIDGQDDRVDVSLVELNIKVTKSHEDEWELLVARDLAQNFISEGIVTDGELFFSRFFGIYCNYTSTRSDKFFFDELSITGDSYSDLAAPKLDSLIVMSDSSLQLFFNEKMLAASISSIDNYFVNNGIGNPEQVEFYQDSTAILYFEEKFNDAVENQISIHGVEDLFGNSVNNLVMHFSYFKPYIIGFDDILISEIMADPSPKVDLPEYEYIEIHNPLPELFHLDLAKLIIGDDTTYIPDLTIEPFEYIVLCQHAAVEHFENFGRTIKITNWPSLNNRGEYIILLNKNEEIVYAVNYIDSWCKSIDKDDGGYSLEMIDSDFPCTGSANWIASNDPSGGTPGKENSIQEKLTDLSKPEIDKIIAISDSSAIIFLNENIGPREIVPDDILVTPFLEIKEIKLKQPGFSELLIDFNSQISTKTIYELMIKNLADCAGNIQLESSSTFVLPEPADSLDLIINEILFNPWPDGVDFIEIYNQSDKFINLNSISIGNEKEMPITANHFIIEPKQHLAITEDPIILNNHYPGIDMKNVIKTVDLPGFNNDKGDVYLTDTIGRGIDFFHYEESYHSDFLNDIEGVSLERISYEEPTNNPNNWQSTASTAGLATPGKVNSQFIMNGNVNEEISIEPKVFDPGNNGLHDFTTIKCRIQNPGMMATIQILDANGRQVKTIISHKSIGTEEDFKWEGFDDNGQEVRMGPYIVFVELYHLSGIRKKKVVVGGHL